jgi:hypothetical protein
LFKQSTKIYRSERVNVEICGIDVSNITEDEWKWIVIQPIEVQNLIFAAFNAWDTLCSQATTMTDYLITSEQTVVWDPKNSNHEGFIGCSGATPDNLEGGFWGLFTDVAKNRERFLSDAASIW